MPGLRGRRYLAATVTVGVVVVVASCQNPAQSEPPVTPTPAPPPPVETTPTPSAAAQPPASPTCGQIDCLLFDSAADAFAHVLATKPLVVAVGETHAQKGTEALTSTTHRFTENLLPLLAHQASDLVLELWVADGKCGRREQEVAQQQKPVTETQSKGNQNEFLALGNKAESLGIRPHVLRPTCEEYEAIVSAGDDAIVQMLEMIARLTTKLVDAILDRNQRQGAERVVITYGGIVHNDLVPRPGREKWSYGPALKSRVQGRYVEVDLIVPEYIKDAPPWTSLDWTKRFDRTVHADRARLLQPSPGSYVLVFPKWSASKAGGPAQPAR